MPSHRDRRVTSPRSESAPPRSGRPKDDDDRSTQLENALGWGAALRATVHRPAVRASHGVSGSPEISSLASRVPPCADAAARSGSVA